MLRYTWGINSFDTRRADYVPPILNISTWEQYLDRLQVYSCIPRLPETKQYNTPWTAPFLIPPGQRRTKENVMGSAAFLSVDLGVAGWTIARLNDRFNGFARCCYTTTTSRPDWQRWRVVLLLDREVSAHWDEPSQSWIGEYVSFWRFVNDLLDGELDHRTCNCNRILYVPARWEGADNVFVRYKGIALPVDDVLAAYPVTKPQPVLIVDVADMKAAPDGAPVVTDRMVAAYQSGAKGGRYWKLLISAAARFRSHGWELTADELHNAAVFAVGRQDRDARREAEKAIIWAQCHCQPDNGTIQAKVIIDKQRKYRTQRRLTSFRSAL